LRDDPTHTIHGVRLRRALVVREDERGKFHLASRDRIIVFHPELVAHIYGKNSQPGRVHVQLDRPQDRVKNDLRSVWGEHFSHQRSHMVSEGGAEPDGGVELTLNRLGCHRAPRAVDLADQLNDLGRETDQNLGDRESLAVNAREKRCQINV
jgi:hypothetical protein